MVLSEMCFKLRLPAFESNSVLHITPTDSASMQDLVTKGQQQLHKSCPAFEKGS